MTRTRVLLMIVGVITLLAQGCCGHRKWVCHSSCAPVISCCPKVCAKPSVRVIDSCDCN